MRESEPGRGLADGFHDRRSIDLSTSSVHRGILESTAVWRDEDDTRAFAERLAARPAIANAFITLHGDLGAGKTTLARHLLRALGVTGRIVSPTFAVVEPYEVAWPQQFGEKTLDASPDAPDRLHSTLSIWHFDFYRFSDPREWEDAGFRDIFASPGLKLAEWPEHAGAMLPAADLAIEIELRAEDESRAVRLAAHSACGQELVA